MTVTHRCPDRKQLQQHVAARLRSDQEAELIAHLDSCADCQQTIEGLACSDDTLWRLARELVTSTASFTSSLHEIPAGPISLSFLDPSPNAGLLGRLCHYDVLEVVGRGGMGIVLKAHDSKLQRTVAIKVLAPYLAGSDRSRQRFLREARAAAAIRHENVVDIHAVDEFNGLPYLVMEYISGPTLQQLLDQSEPLDLQTLLRISMQIARGLAAAHAQGLIHRDIKPSNILLENRTEQVKITDFGLARGVDDALVTQPGVVAGTPEYMSPEQALGEPIDHRADLFSLGSVMYAIFSGCSPFAANGSLAVMRRIMDESPRPIQESKPGFPTWLSDIIERLHAKDPADRFQSAGEVADLLQQHLACISGGEVSLAMMPRPGGLQQKSWRDRRALIGTAAVAILLFVCVALQAIVIRIRDKDGNETVHRPPPGSTIAVERNGQRVATFADEEVVSLGGHRGKVWNVAFAPGRILTGGEDGWVRVWDLKTAQEVQRFDGHRHTVYGLAVTPDGKRAISGSGCQIMSKIEDVDWSLCLWEIETGKELQRFAGHGQGITSLVLSPDGRKALIGMFEGTVILWDVEKWQEIRRFRAPTGMWSVAYSPDGMRCVTASAFENVTSVILWNLEIGQELKRYVGHKSGIWHVTFMPGGKSILTGGQDETIRYFETDTAKQVHMYRHQSQVARIAVTADGRFALAGTWGDEARKNLRLWRLDTEQEMHVFRGLDVAIHSVALSPDNRWAVAGGTDGSVKLWKVPEQIVAQMSPAAAGGHSDK